MKKLYIILFAAIIWTNFSAQVGINTENPKTTLQVQKKDALTFPDGVILPRVSGDSLKLKDAAYGPDQNGALVFVTSPVTTPSLKTTNVSTAGIYSYDATFTHSNSTQGIWNQLGEVEGIAGANDLYALKADGNLGLLNLGLDLLGSRFYRIPLPNSSGGAFDVEIPSPQVAGSGYTVPIDGTYVINYSFRTGTGVRAELLSGARPGALIRKTSGGSSTILDYRLFGGVSLSIVLNVSVSQAQISHIYKLKAGDFLEFGLVQGGLGVGVLSDTSAELSIYRIR